LKIAVILQSTAGARESDLNSANRALATQTSMAVELRESESLGDR